MTDLQTIWIALLAIAAPIAGVVGFALQLRSVRKLRLENHKLTLEIRALEESLQKADARIVRPSTDEVSKVTRSRTRDEAMFSRSRHGHADDGPWKRATRLSLGEIGLLTAVVFVLLYFIYDLYRLAAWLVSRWS